MLTHATPITFSAVIHGKIPSKSNCYRVVTLSGHGSIAKTSALKTYERNFYMQCPQRERQIEGLFVLNADVYHENMRPDLDNAFKVLLDMLQACRVIKNDRQCVEIHARKLVDKQDPRVELTLTELK